MSDSTEKPFAQQPLTIAAGAVLLVVLICLGIVLFGGFGGEGNAEPTEPTRQETAENAAPTTDSARPATKSVAPLPTDSTYNSACGLSGGSTVIPSSAPADVKWESEEGWYFPVSESAGPENRAPKGPWSCFAQTPTGAVLAGYTIAMRVDGAAEFWEEVVKAQTVPGVAQQTRLEGGAPTPADTPTVPLGYLVDSYTNDAATVTYYLRSGSYEVSCSLQVEWQGGDEGDWMLRLQSNGDTVSGCIQGAPSRYVPWSPVP